eukprot:gene7840-12313_t
MLKQKSLEWKKHDGKIYRSCHQAIYYKDNLFLFLGEKKEEYDFSNRVVKYNPSTNSLYRIPTRPSPIARRNHVVLSRNNFAYLFGGDYERLSDGNELLKFDLEKNEWTEVHFEKSQVLPSPRKYHCGCTCNNDLYFFGGECTPEQQFNDLWRLDMNEKWCCIIPRNDNIPDGRRYASIVSHLDCLYLFGGRNDEKRFNDLWSFNTFTCEWKLVEGTGDVPKARASQTAVVDQNSMWIYGGNNGNITNELYEFSILTSTWRKVLHDNHFPRYWHVSVLSDNHEMIIHGGWNDDNLDDFMSLELPVLKKDMKQQILVALKEKIYDDILIKIQKQKN